METKQIQALTQMFRRKRNVYLDNNATTPISKKVWKSMCRAMKQYGNPSSLYGKARDAARLIEKSRKQVANAIGSDSGEVFFTSCATESNNTILKTLATEFYPLKTKIIATPIEHSSVISTLEYLETRGIIVEYCPVDREGRVILSELAAMIDSNTFLICCMMANNEIGTIQDIKAISGLAKKYNVLLMSDCVQALGKIPVDVHELGVDYASFSAHKLHGPKGIGALYIKEGKPLLPLLHGGHQEQGMRAGTESVHNIAGFGVACTEVDRMLKTADKQAELKERFIEKLKTIYPDCKVFSPQTNCVPNTMSIAFPGISNSALMAMLDFRGIAVSAGSACSSPENKPSHVLTAIGVSEIVSMETIRISLGSETTWKDLDFTLRTFKKYLNEDSLAIDMITPVQLDELALQGDEYYVMDIRPNFMRTQLESLPNAHEYSYFSLGRHLKELPRDKQIVVACQHGDLSFATTFYLQTKGFSNVSSLATGTVGWRNFYKGKVEDEIRVKAEVEVLLV